MSTAFTAYANWPNAGQDLAGANEIVLAYSERRQAVGQAAVSPLVATDDSQDRMLWFDMQLWCLFNCTSFVDYVNGPLKPDKSDFLYFTWATALAAAGLNSSGFSRKVNPADAFSYGFITAKDMRGSWNFEELQRFFSVLRWSGRNSVQNLSNHLTTLPWWIWYDQSINSYEDFVANRATRFAEGIALGTDFPWDSDAYGSSVYWVESTYSFGWKGLFTEDGASFGNMLRERTRGKARIVGLPVMRPHTALVYLILYQPSPSPGTFNDLDGVGMVEDEMTLIETFSESSSSSHQQTSYIGDTKDDPWGLAGLTAGMNEVFDDPGYSGGLPLAGSRINGSRWLMKWDFTKI